MNKISFLFCFFLIVIDGLKAQVEDEVIDYTDQSSSQELVNIENTDSLFYSYPNHELNFQILHLMKVKFQNIKV